MSLGSRFEMIESSRSFHLIAMACQDQSVRIAKITVDESQRHTVNLLASLDDHKSQVWRVAWNITGSILASSGDDGKVLLWKSDFYGTWHCVQTLESSAGE